jgi:hypothetical protein
MKKKDNRYQFHWEKLVYSIILIFFLFIVLTPILFSGYIWDDSISSCIRGFLFERNITLNQFVLDSYLGWFTMGRIFPLAFYYPYLHFFIGNVMLYKLFIVITIISSIILFTFLLYSITESFYFSIQTAFISLITFSITLYHNAYLGYNGLVQFVFIYTLISLIFLKYYLNTNRFIYYILSIFIFSCAIFTYEISYVFFLFHFVLVHFFSKINNPFKELKILFPYIFLPIFGTIAALSIKFFNGLSIIGSNSSTAYLPNFDFFSIIITMSKNIVAAFPLSYYIIDPNKIFAHGITDFLSDYIIILIIIMIFYGIILLNLSKKVSIEIKGINVISIKKILIFAFSLIILPTVIISLSPKYQSELLWGIGYSPIYISSFGVALVISISFFYFYIPSIQKKINWTYTKIFCIFCILIIGFISLNANYLVISQSNHYWKYPRELIERSMDKGLFDNMPDNSTLIVQNGNGWDISAFYRMHLGDKIKYFGTGARHWHINGYDIHQDISEFLISNTSNIYSYNFPQSSNVYYLSYESVDDKTGHVTLAKINYLNASSDKIYSVRSDNLFLFIETNNISNNNKKLENISIITQVSDSVDLQNLRDITIKSDQMKILSYEKDWQILTIDNFRNINPQSLLISNA